MSDPEHSEPQGPHRERAEGGSSAERSPDFSTDRADRRRANRPIDPVTANVRNAGRGKRILKWAALVVGLIFFLAVLREAMDPFGDKPYIEISHGDHVHYVPQDRDPNVPMGRFPTTEPAADERITPDGRVVKKD